VNVEITCSNACRNAGLLSIEIIFSLKESEKLVDWKNKLGLVGTFLRFIFPAKFGEKVFSNVTISFNNNYHNSFVTQGFHSTIIHIWSSKSGGKIAAFDWLLLRV